MAEIDPYTRRVFLTRIRDFVGGLRFPASGEAVVAFAARRNTPGPIMAELERLRGQNFDRLDDVVKAVDARRYGEGLALKPVLPSSKGTV